MAALLIKDLPPRLHAWLKEEAIHNRRSMTQQTIVLLEERMHKPIAIHLPPPFKLKGPPPTMAEMDRAKKEGRR